MILIKWNEWIVLQKYTGCKRSKFLSPFTKLLNLRLNKEDIKCSLKCNNNYFSTAKSTIPKHFWRGYYKCVRCKSTYVAIIKNIHVNKDVLIEIYIENKCDKCTDKEVKIRVANKERNELAKDLLIRGTLTIKSENIIFNEENSDSIHSMYQ